MTTSRAFDVAAFGRDLQRLQARWEPAGFLPHGVPDASASRSPATGGRSDAKAAERPGAFPLDPNALRRLSADIHLAELQMRARADQLIRTLADEWPGDPRVSAQSVLGPLGMRRREVALTTAMVWMMQPRITPLHAEALAVLVEELLDLPLTPSDVRGWAVRGEERVTVDSRDGRVDICAEGELHGMHHCLIVEVKIDAAESPGQTLTYKRAKLAAGGRTRKQMVTTCFLSPAGLQAESDKESIPMDFRRLFALWLPVLRRNAGDRDAPFFTMFLADMARDLAQTHLVDALRTDGVPIGLDTLASTGTAQL